MRSSTRTKAAMVKDADKYGKVIEGTAVSSTSTSIPKLSEEEPTSELRREYDEVPSTAFSNPVNPKVIARDGKTSKSTFKFGDKRRTIAGQQRRSPTKAPDPAPVISRSISHEALGFHDIGQHYEIPASARQPATRPSSYYMASPRVHVVQPRNPRPNPQMPPPTGIFYSQHSSGLEPSFPSWAPARPMHPSSAIGAGIQAAAVSRPTSVLSQDLAMQTRRNSLPDHHSRSSPDDLPRLRTPQAHHATYSHVAGTDIEVATTRPTRPTRPMPYYARQSYVTEDARRKEQLRNAASDQDDSPSIIHPVRMPTPRQPSLHLNQPSSPAKYYGATSLGYGDAYRSEDDSRVRRRTSLTPGSYEEEDRMRMPPPPRPKRPSVDAKSTAYDLGTRTYQVSKGNRSRNSSRVIVDSSLNSDPEPTITIRVDNGILRVGDSEIKCENGEAITIYSKGIVQSGDSSNNPKLGLESVGANNRRARIEDASPVDSGSNLGFVTALRKSHEAVPFHPNSRYTPDYFTSHEKLSARFSLSRPSTARYRHSTAYLDDHSTLTERSPSRALGRVKKEVLGAKEVESNVNPQRRNSKDETLDFKEQRNRLETRMEFKDPESEREAGLLRQRRSSRRPSKVAAAAVAADSQPTPNLKVPPTNQLRSLKSESSLSSKQPRHMTLHGHNLGGLLVNEGLYYPNDLASPQTDSNKAVDNATQSESAEKPRFHVDRVDIVKSDRGRSRSRNSSEINGAVHSQQVLNGGPVSEESDLGEAEYQQFLSRIREKRRRKRFASGSIGKRLIAESMGSEADREDIGMIFDTNEVGSSARRLRRKLNVKSLSPPIDEKVDQSTTHQIVNSTTTMHLPIEKLYVSTEQDQNNLKNSHESKSDLPMRTRRHSFGSESVVSILSDLSSIFDKTSTVGTDDTSLEELGKSALEQAIEVFYQHPELQQLYEAALNKVSIGRLQDNLTRLFKRFGNRLKFEASSPPEHQAAVFVYNQAVNIAGGLRTLFLDPTEEKAEKKHYVLEDWLDNLAQGADDHEKEQDGDDHIQTLEGLKVFLTSSKAFDNLVADFRMWLKINQSQPAELEGTAADYTERAQLEAHLNLLPEARLPNRSPCSHMEQERWSQLQVAVSTTATLCSGEVDTSESLPAISRDDTMVRSRRTLIAGVFDAVSVAYHFIRNIARPKPAGGLVRVGWRCQCGEHLDIDVPEDCQQAAVDFAHQAAGDDSSHSRNVSLTRSESNESSTSSRSLTTINSISTPVSDVDETVVTSPSITDDDGSSIQAPPPGTKKYLLLCVKKGMNSIGLKNVDLTSVGHDEVLFHQIRAAYHELRGGRNKNPFLVPRTIDYIKFELLNRQQTGQCIGNFEADSIPSLKEVLQGQYTFRPCPPDIGKYPIHPHIFMHALLRPGDHMGTVATERLPKKLNDELRANTTNDPFNLPIGWGIYIIDGYNWRLIRTLLAVLLVICFIVAVIWSAVQGDTQGGMGIGQFAVAFVVSGLTTAFLGRSGWESIAFASS